MEQETDLNKFIDDLKIKYEKDVIFYGTKDLKCVFSFFPRKINNSTKSKANEIISQLHLLRSKAARDRKRLETLEAEIVSDNMLMKQLMTEGDKLEKLSNEILDKFSTRMKSRKFFKMEDSINKIKQEIIRLKEENSLLKKENKSYERNVIKTSNKDLENILRWESVNKCVKKNLSKKIAVNDQIKNKLGEFKIKVCNKDVEEIDLDPKTYEDLMINSLYCCHAISFGLISEAQEAATILVNNLKINQYREFFLFYLLFRRNEMNILLR